MAEVRGVRPPACVGCYEGDPARLRRQLARMFAAPGAPGPPGPPRPDPTFRGALVPHIDYARGGRIYAWGYKEVVERTAASLFVVVGTSHYSRHRFTLTRRDFATPLGVVPTDQGFIDRLVRHYGPGLFDDEAHAHDREHSIELEAVLLRYLYEAVRPVRVVPLLVGSFYDSVLLGRPPSRLPDVARMIGALRAAEAETPEPVCTLISGDLAHIGPEFGDAAALGDGDLAASAARDAELLQQTADVSARGYYDVVRAEDDRRRVCGFPPTYLALEALGLGRGEVLHYDQYVQPDRRLSVSFASVAFSR